MYVINWCMGFGGICERCVDYKSCEETLHGIVVVKIEP
jgi:hypothetical protein